jgi:hypothetical protein
MITLNKPTENLGGFLALWAVPPSDIVLSSANAMLLSTDRIIKLYCSPGSITFTEKEVREKSGIIYQCEITGFIPRDSPEGLEIILRMSGRKWIVILLDQNEQYKVAGSSQIPLRVSFDLEAGADPSDRSGHIVSFFGSQLSKARFINNPFSE